MFRRLVEGLEAIAAELARLYFTLAELVGAIGDLALAIGSQTPPIPPVEPPVKPPTEPFIWDRNTPRQEWINEINGIPVGYVRVAYDDLSPLVIDTPGDGVVPSTVESRGKPGNTRSQRIVPAPGLVIMVRKDGEIYGKKGMEHIAGVGNPDFHCRPWQLDGGVLGFAVMHEQKVDGHYIAEDPHRNKPLYVKASNVIEFV